MRLRSILFVAAMLTVTVASQAAMTDNYNLPATATLTGSQSLDGLSLSGSGTLTINGSSSPVLTIGDGSSLPALDIESGQTVNLTGNVNLVIPDGGGLYNSYTPSLQIIGGSYTGSSTVDAGQGLIYMDSGATVAGTHTFNTAYLFVDGANTQVNGVLNVNINTSAGNLDEGLYIGDGFFMGSATPTTVYNAGGTITGSVYVQQQGTFAGSSTINGNVWISYGSKISGAHTINGNLNLRVNSGGAGPNQAGDGWGYYAGDGKFHLAPSDTPGTFKTLTVTAGHTVTLDSPTALDFQVSNLGSDLLDATNCVVNLGQDTASPTPIPFNFIFPTGFSLAPGNSINCTVLKYGTLNGSFGVKSNRFYDYAFNTGSGTVSVNIGRATNSTLWTGLGGNTNLSNGGNWDNGAPGSSTIVGLAGADGTAKTLTIDSTPATIGRLAIDGNCNWNITAPGSSTLNASQLFYTGTGASTISSLLSLTGNVTVISGSLDIKGPFTGNTTLTSGTLTVEGSSASGNFLVNAGTMSLTAPLSTLSSVTLNGGSMTLGGGTQTYTGATNVNSGGLTLAAGTSITSSYLTLGLPASGLSASAVLYGSGTISKEVVLGNGGSLQANASGLTISVPGGTALVANSGTSGSGWSIYSHTTIIGDVSLAGGGYWGSDTTTVGNITINGTATMSPTLLTINSGAILTGVGSGYSGTGASSLTYNGSPSAVWTIQNYGTTLAGNGTFNINSGTVDITNNTNTFSGTFNVNGGTLWADVPNYLWTTAGKALGTATIDIGATGGAATNATLLLDGNNHDWWNNNVYSQPIVVRAGNSGAATIQTIDNYTDSTQITGGITLNKDVTLVNNWQRAEYWNDNRGALYVDSAITGTGNVIKGGIGNLWLDGNNTFTGNLIVKSGEVYINGGSNAFTGSYQVQNGYLCFDSSAHLGTNNMVLGSANGQGIIASQGGTSNTLTNNISLTGMGGVVDDRESGLTFNGNITGSGSLTFRGFNWTDVIAAANSYSGGTQVINTNVGVTSTGTLGSGPVLVARHGWLNFVSSSSYSSNVFTLQGATAGDPLVQIPILTIPVNATTAPVISSNSSNFVLLFDNDYRNNVWNASTSAAINALVANPIGDGTGFLGAGSPYDNGNWGCPMLFTPDSLAIGAGNTYRFATRSEFQVNRDGVNNGDTNGLLVDVGGVPANVQIGTSSIDYQGYTTGGVDLLDNNSYTGLTTVVGNAWLHACPSTSATNPLGAPSGNVVLNGGYLSVDGHWQPRVNGNLNPVVVQKNNLSVEAHPILAVNSNWDDQPAFLQLASITRVNNSVLRIAGGGQGWDPNAYLGGNERIGISSLTSVGGMAAVNGVVAPWLIETKDSIHTGDFLNYGGNVTGSTPGTGLVRATYTVNGTAGGVNSQTDFNNTIPGDIVNVLSNISVSGTKTVYALKVGSAEQDFNRTTGNWETHYTDNLNISGSGTICVTSGAMIATGPGPWGDSTSYNPGWGGTPSGNINVISPNITTGNNGANELVIYTPHMSWEQATEIDGQIITTGGLTKSGNGTLLLNGDNHATLQGNITLDAGTIQIHNANSLGSGTIVMNNQGTAGWQYGLSTLGLTAPLTINNQIYLGNNGGQVCSDNSKTVTYAGKITGPGSFTNWGNQIVITNKTSDYSGGTMVRGDIYLPPSIGTLQGSATGPLGTGPVYVGQPLEIGDQYALQNNPVIFDYHAGPGRIYMWSSAVLGSIEGGDINTCIFMYNNNETLTVGGDNRSTDFYGQIQTNNSGCGLTKVGSGALSLWGPSTYNGATNVNNGTLNNNGSLLGAVTVTSVSGSTPLYGGTGTTAGLVTVHALGTANGSGIFNAGLTLVGGGTATGNITINGPVSVDGASSFSSNGPITGAVATAGNFSGNANITGNVNVTGGTFGGNHVINGTFASNAAVSGASIFNGAVTVAGGTFTGTHMIAGNYTQNAGSFSGTSIIGTALAPVAVTINAGSFSGNNTINGSFTTTAGSNAVVAPHNGDTAGTLAIVGTTTLDHNTVLNFNLGPAGTTGGNVNDLIDVTGNLSLDGTLNVTNLSGFATGTYAIIDYTGSLTGAGLTLGTTPTGYNYKIVTTTPNEIELSVTPFLIPGDTNGDGAVNSLDIDAIYRHLTVLPPGFTGWNGVGGDQPWPWAQSAYQAQYDVNNDQAVSQDDVTYELRNYFLTSYGDADLNRATDFQDFQALLDHWQNSGAGIGWAEADFNGDGVVDFLDFQNLLDYWNPSGWNFAPTQTPEPASLSLILLGGLALLRRNRK